MNPNLSLNARTLLKYVPDDFKVELHIENGYAYIGKLLKGNWVIWKISGGYQAARMINGNYQDHHSEPLSSNSLAQIEDAIRWVNQQIQEGKK